MNIGDKIRKVRELKGFKQEYVADKLGMSVTAYGNIERNSSDLTFGKLEQVATVLEVTVQDIINIPEQLNIQSITNSQVGFNYYDHRTRTEIESEIGAYKMALDHSQKEIEYLRQQNTQLLELLGKKA
jgi:transcriptional regulator with XRE-family HTH domain